MVAYRGKSGQHRKTFTGMTNLESLLKFDECYSDPQEYHAGTGKTCKLHTERPQPSNVNQ